MRKLTQVSIALVLGLLVSLSMFGAGAFAQSANQALKNCGVGRFNGQLQGGNWGWNGECNTGGCQFSNCDNTNHCATVMQSFKTFQLRREVSIERVAVVHRVVLTSRVLRVVREMVTVHQGLRVLHVWRAVNVWQVQHVVHLIKAFQTHQVVHLVKTLQVSQRSVRLC